MRRAHAGVNASLSCCEWNCAVSVRTHQKGSSLSHRLCTQVSEADERAVAKSRVKSTTDELRSP